MYISDWPVGDIYNAESHAPRLKIGGCWINFSPCGTYKRNVNAPLEGLFRLRYL